MFFGLSICLIVQFIQDGTFLMSSFFVDKHRTDLSQAYVRSQFHSSLTLILWKSGGLHVEK